MQKKYIIAVVLVAIVWTGFMVYRHQRNKQGATSYQDRTQKQMQEIAKKSPRGAMVLIGRALDRYHKEHHQYPAKLQDIYPKYMAHKSLLEKTNFYYERKGEDFYLSTTFTVDRRTIVAYMEKDLRPQVDMGTMVAAPTPVKQPKAVQEVSGVKKVELSAEARTALARENLINALRRGAFNVAAVSIPNREEQRLIAAAMPRVISESEAASDLEPELGHRYLVWKGPTGVLGFSDVQYPDSDRLSVYVYGRWYDIKMPKRQREDMTRPKAVKAASKPRPGDIAAKIEGGCLVWKDDRGTVGFGNVQYPPRHLAAVFESNIWTDMERQYLPIDDAGGETIAEPEKKSVDRIASQFGSQYLVWKGKKGVLGFGDTQYPQTGLDLVYDNAQWVGTARSVQGPETDAAENRTAQTKRSSEEIASEFAGKFLVWRGKDGSLGFGNVQYPGQNLELVFDADRWVQAGQAQPVDKGRAAQREKATEKTSHENLAAAMSNRYLVWKDKWGTLGFGDVQYPDMDRIVGVHVDGRWESVAN